MYAGPNGQRRAALDRHVAGLASGHPRRVQRAHAGLAKMKATEAEHRYVHIETQKRVKPGPVTATNPLGLKSVQGVPTLRRRVTRTVKSRRYNAAYGPSVRPQTAADVEWSREHPVPMPHSASSSPYGVFGHLPDLNPTAVKLGEESGIAKPAKSLYSMVEGLGYLGYTSAVEPWVEVRHGRNPLASNTKYAKKVERMNDAVAESVATLPSTPQEAAMWGLPFLRGGRALAEAAAAAKGAEEASVIGRASAGARAAGESYREGKGLLAPAGRLASRRARKALVRGPKRTEEQAAQHVAERIQKDAAQLDVARAEGKMGGPVNLLKQGEVTAETGGTTGRIIRHGLNPDLKKGGKYEKVGARLDDPKLLRKAQEELRAPYRSAQVSAAERAAEGKSGLDWLEAATGALKGKHPSVEFRGFAKLTPELRDEALDFIRDHPRMQFHTRRNAMQALNDALEGKVPTPGEQKLLEMAFGKEAPGGLIAEAKKNGWGQTVNDVLGISRALRSSIDFSFPMRQGAVALAYNPKLWLEQYWPGLKSMRSEANYQSAMKTVEELPTHPSAVHHKVAFVDIGESAAKGADDIYLRDEAMPSNYAERLPLIGGKIRASDRGYVGVGNLIRGNLYDYMVHKAARQGYHLTNELMDDAAKIVNTFTGRGDIKHLQSIQPTMNALLFSPRLLQSRLNMLNPVWYARLHPFARQEAMKAASRFFGAIGLALLAVEELAGGTVSIDPRSADFGKIKIGDTRIDLGAGFNQVIHLYGQYATMQRKSTTTGRVTDLTGSGFGQDSLFSVGLQFLENKTNPIASTAINALKGNQFGQPLDFSLNPFDTNSLISNLYEPMSPQDALSTYQQTGSALAGIGGGLLAATGVGVQSYSANKADSPDKIKAATDKALEELHHQEKVLNVPAEWRRVYEKGVKVKVQRDLAKDQARKESPTGKITDAEAFKITLKVLLKNGMMKPSEYKGTLGAIRGMGDHDLLSGYPLSHWEYEAWYQFGPGKILEDLHHQYNVTTGQ